MLIHMICRWSKILGFYTFVFGKDSIQNQLFRFILNFDQTGTTDSQVSSSS